MLVGRGLLLILKRGLLLWGLLWSIGAARIFSGGHRGGGKVLWRKAEVGEREEVSRALSSLSLVIRVLREMTKRRERSKRRGRDRSSRSRGGIEEAGQGSNRWEWGRVRSGEGEGTYRI